MKSKTIAWCAAFALALPLAALAQNIALVNGKPVPKARVDTLLQQATRAGMPGMGRAVVVHLDLARRERGAQAGLDRARVHRGSLGAGAGSSSRWRPRYRPCATTKTIISPVVPKDLKVTQASRLKL